MDHCMSHKENRTESVYHYIMKLYDRIKLPYQCYRFLIIFITVPLSFRSSRPFIENDSLLLRLLDKTIYGVFFSLALPLFLFLPAIFFTSLSSLLGLLPYINCQNYYLPYSRHQSYILLTMTVIFVSYFLFHTVYPLVFVSLDM